ncbi:hypothetical protein GCM10010376_95200 [Streptomyces violaceusniger]
MLTVGNKCRPLAKGPSPYVCYQRAGPAAPVGAAGPPARQTCFRPGFPASLTNDAAVVSGAPWVVTAETVL